MCESLCKTSTGRVSNIVRTERRAERSRLSSDGGGFGVHHATEPNTIIPRPVCLFFSVYSGSLLLIDGIDFLMEIVRCCLLYRAKVVSVVLIVYNIRAIPSFYIFSIKIISVLSYQQIHHHINNIKVI